MIRNIASKIFKGRSGDGDNNEDDDESKVVWEQSSRQIGVVYEKKFRVELKGDETVYIRSLWPSTKDGCLIFYKPDIDSYTEDELLSSKPNTGFKYYISECIPLSGLRGNTVSESVNVESCEKMIVIANFEEKIIEYKNMVNHYTQQCRNINIETEYLPSSIEDEPKGDRDTIEGMIKYGNGIDEER